MKSWGLKRHFAYITRTYVTSDQGNQTNVHPTVRWCLCSSVRNCMLGSIDPDRSAGARTKPGEGNRDGNFLSGKHHRANSAGNGAIDLLSLYPGAREPL